MTRLAVLGSAAVALALVLVATRQGVGASHDAAVYLAGAESIADGDGYDRYDDRPITSTPPGFSLTLSAAVLAGMEPATGARLLNAAAAAGLVLMTYGVTRRHVRDGRLAVGAAAVVAVSATTVDVFSYAWSEPVFCLLTMALLAVLERLYDERSRDRALLLGAGALAAALCAYRFVGGAFAAVAFGVVVAGARRDGWGAVMRRAGAFVAVAAIAPILLLARIARVGGSLLGDRTPPLVTAGEFADQALTVGSTWVLPAEVPRVVRVVALFVVVIVTVSGLVLAGRRTARPDGRPVLSLGPAVAMVAVYLVALTWSALSYEIDPLSLRLLAPAFAPSVVLVSVAVDAHLERRSLPIVTRLAGPSALLWVAGSLFLAGSHARHWGDDGRGLREERWRESSLIAAVEAADPDGAVFSNFPDALYVTTGRRPVHESPAVIERDDLVVLQDAVDDQGSVLLAWFDLDPHEALLSPDDLGRVGLSVEPVATSADGVLYRIG